MVVNGKTLAPCRVGVHALRALGVKIKENTLSVIIVVVGMILKVNEIRMTLTIDVDAERVSFSISSKTDN